MRLISETSATFKICIFGEGGVGKTTLCHKYLTGLFEVGTTLTMGAQLFVKHLTIEDLKVALQIWDFGGEKQYRFLLPTYAFGSSAGIIAYDITRYPTIKSIKEWLNSFYTGLKDEEHTTPIYMIGTKLDLQEKRAVSYEDAYAIFKANNLVRYLETSAKTGENVDKLFETITIDLLHTSSII